MDASWHTHFRPVIVLMALLALLAASVTPAHAKRPDEAMSRAEVVALISAPDAAQQIEGLPKDRLRYLQDLFDTQLESELVTQRLQVLSPAEALNLGLEADPGLDTKNATSSVHLPHLDVVQYRGRQHLDDTELVRYLNAHYLVFHFECGRSSVPCQLPADGEVLPQSWVGSARTDDPRVHGRADQYWRLHADSGTSGRPGIVEHQLLNVGRW